MKNPVRSLELELLRELSELDYYVVKTPLNSKDFWREWQEKYSKAHLTSIALRSLLRKKRLSRKEYLRAKDLLRKYGEILAYLESLKSVALSSRGYSGGYFVEFEEDDEEEGEGGI
ncbi:MAG: hypothetical protein GXN96_01680 [Aquificae bacterium]|nr:hypothetical protein [Aquificota bacterium]